jgi:hypothetical protein
MCLRKNKVRNYKQLFKVCKTFGWSTTNDIVDALLDSAIEESGADTVMKEEN